MSKPAKKRDYLRAATSDLRGTHGLGLGPSIEVWDCPESVWGMWGVDDLLQRDEASDMTRQLVKAAVPNMVNVADLDGARVHAAAGMLCRTVELLDSARSVDQVAGAPLVELALRSIFELTCRARFLLVCSDGRDEFIQMCRGHQKRQWRVEKDSGNPSAAFMAPATSWPHVDQGLGQDAHRGAKREHADK